MTHEDQSDAILPSANAHELTSSPQTVSMQDVLNTLGLPLPPEDMETLEEIESTRSRSHGR
eukprot:5669620-Amphidinium_carterae.1